MATELGAFSVRSSIALARLDPKLRDQYAEMFGRHTLEAVSVHDQNAVLWTDDHIVAILAEAEFGVRRVWTQLVFSILESGRKITSDAYDEIVAKLLDWNYVATVWCPQDIIAAGVLCDRDVNGRPLKRCIGQLGTSPLPPGDKAGAAAEFFRLLRRSSCSGLKQTAAIRAVLDALRDPRLVNLILRSLDRIFYVDPISSEFFKAELAYWLWPR